MFAPSTCAWRIGWPLDTRSRSRRNSGGGAIRRSEHWLQRIDAVARLSTGVFFPACRFRDPHPYPHTAHPARHLPPLCARRWPDTQPLTGARLSQQRLLLRRALRPCRTGGCAPEDQPWFPWPG
jgi:hypothetical protein